MSDIYDFSELDEVAATIPAGYLKSIKSRDDAVLVAKQFCECGATLTYIDELASAILDRIVLPL